MLKNYFLIGIRNLWRNKVFSAINIIGLSIGLACCMLIYLYTMDELSYDKFHANKENIYRITSTIVSPDGNKNESGITGMMPGPAFKNSIPEIESYVRIQNEGLTIRHNNEVYDQEAQYVDENFFRFFSFPLLSGSPTTVFNNLRSVVLSEELAIKYFGTRDAMGKILELKFGEDFEPFEVAGVAKTTPQNSSLKIKVLLPMKFAESRNKDTEWINFYLNTFVALKPGSNITAVENKFQQVFQREAAEQLKVNAEKYGFKEKVSFGLQPLLDMHLSTRFQAMNGLYDASNPVYSYILSAIAILILVIACINFVNLTIGRSLKRNREIGIRKCVGGQRSQLIVQFLGESFIVSVIAFGFALVLVNLVLPYFNTLANKALSFSYLFNIKLVLGYALLLCVTAFLAGFYPALVLSGFNPVKTLYGRETYGGKNYLSKGMVVFQFTLSTFLIIAVITIYTQFNYLTRYDLGYNDKGVAHVSAGRMDKAKLDVLRTELMKHPGIEKVAADQGGGWITGARINNGTDITFDYKYIDETYLPLFEIPVIMGRNFSYPIDTANGVIVNESFVKKAGWKNPLEQEVDFFYHNRKMKVVGVIRDYHYASLNETIQPQLFTFHPSHSYNDVYLKISSGSLAGAQDHMLKTFKTFFPFRPYAVNFKEDENLAAYESEAKWKQIITMGAILTIVISSIGLLGLATIAAQKRTREIGIRKVLGASVYGIVRNLSLDFLKLVLVAALIAFPIAWWATNQWLENYPYRTEISWWIFISAGMLVTLIALMTIGFQAYSAALAKPVNSLKAE